MSNWIENELTITKSDPQFCGMPSEARTRPLTSTA
jgi:hypothetical protein